MAASALVIAAESSAAGAPPSTCALSVLSCSSATRFVVSACSVLTSTSARACMAERNEPPAEPMISDSPTTSTTAYRVVEMVPPAAVTVVVISGGKIQSAATAATAPTMTLAKTPRSKCRGSSRPGLSIAPVRPLTVGEAHR